MYSIFCFERQEAFSNRFLKNEIVSSVLLSGLVNLNLFNPHINPILKKKKDHLYEISQSNHGCHRSLNSITFIIKRICYV